MTNLDSVLKSRDITLPTKVHIVKVVVFPVVTWHSESWTVKAEHQRIDAFELRCWRRLLNALWAARSSSQSILREISPEYALEGLMLKPVVWSSDVNRLIGEVPDVGKDRGQKEKRASEDEMAGWHQQCNERELGQTLGGGDGQGSLACCSPWGRNESDTTGQLNNNENSRVVEIAIALISPLPFH